jgi:G3E family GTPase
VDDEIPDMYSLDGIITVCDSKHIVERFDDEKPEGVENEAVEQVAFADRILLNKTDLVEDAELPAIEARIKKINPHVQIFRCQQSKVEPKNLIGIDSFDLKKTLEMDPEFLDTEGEHEHDPRVSSTSTKFEGFLNVKQLNMWISEVVKDMGADLFRYKGVLSVAGMTRKFVFQGVGMLFSGGFVDVEWAEGEKRENCFVFIGRDLDKAKLIDGFMACQCSEELRFKIGDSVKARVGDRECADADGYCQGTILKQWDNGNAYRIEIEDGKKTNVWGPIDEDDYVKKA